jgi:type II secretory pathway component PulF
MPAYRTRCVTQGGQFFAQEFDAPNVAALRAAVESRGAFLIGHTELKPGSGGRRAKLSMATLVQLFDLLAMQLGAGVPAEVAVAKLKDEFPDRIARKILRGVHAELSRSTASLSGALAKYPRSFPDGLIAAIRVGEESGGAALAARFEDLRDQIAFRIQIRKTAAKAVAYPIFILCFASCVIGLLMVKLVPNIKLLLDSLNVPLPEITRLVLGFSVFVQSHWRLILIAVGAGLAFFRVCRLAPVSGTLIDRLLLRLPLVGGIFKALVTAEVAKNYRALYAAGADAGSTFAACAAVVRNRALRAALLRSRTLVESGIVTAGKPDAPAITEALRATGYLPELALTIIGTGESSGSLSQALENVARHYSTKAQERIQVFFAVFDKAVMLALIAAVGAVVIGMWMPIMTAAENFRY